MNSVSAFPYIHISCPCAEETPLALADINRPRSPIKRDSKQPIDEYVYKRNAASGSQQPAAAEDSEDSDEDDNNFDPRNPRSAFSLFPIENLLYCEDCHQIRCPRCVQDEIVCWFCPSCLFEVPSSTVKSDGNRCTRNCFQCPICTSLLSITSLTPPDLGSDTALGPFTLSCPHCHWSTTELDPPIKFDKPTSLSSQLARATNSRHDTEFAKLKQHYAQQLGNAQEDFTGSPGALTRLMGLYSGVGSGSPLGGRKGRGLKKTEMKEIDRMRVVDAESEFELVQKLAKMGFEETTTSSQRLAQSHNPTFDSDLRPVPALLRTKRSKRCRACRHILVKPESKVQTTRFRIRLVALNYIPRLNLKRMDTTIQFGSLIPHKTHRFVLTVTNPLFDPISVSLLTPKYTPGSNHPSRVTILCPEFEVGANTDVWEESLISTQMNSTTKDTANSTERSVSGSVTNDAKLEEVYERGRNYTSVVVEVVPPEVQDTRNNMLQDERLVEIPLFVKLSYETDMGEDAGGAGGGLAAGAGLKERMDYSYWSVLGIGIIGPPREGVVESAPSTPAKGTPIRKPLTEGGFVTPVKDTPIRRPQ